MTAAQWTVPVVLGLLAAGITWYAPEVAMPQPAGPEIRHDGYVLLPWTTADHESTLLRYNATDTRHRLGGILDVHAAQMRNGTLWWDGSGWECVHKTCPAHWQPVLGDPVDHGDHDPAPTDKVERREGRTGDSGTGDGPSADLVAGGQPGKTVARLGPEHKEVHLSVYIFTSSGHLLATNGPDDDFDRHRDFVPIAQQVWPLHQDGRWHQQAFGILNGTPVGGVQSTVLEEHKYHWLVGPLWVTARVEALTAAAPDHRAG